MGKRSAFILPEGLQFDVSGDQISIRYDGDVEVEVDPGPHVVSISAGGDLTVAVPKVTGSLHAGGVLRIQGDIDGEHLHGREVVLGRQNIRCKSISADERIIIGPGALSCDILLAPEINLDPKAHGRVTVIECLNERGATKIKGGYALADYEDMFGNSREFLAQRGLAPLGTPRSPEERPLTQVPRVQERQGDAGDLRRQRPPVVTKRERPNFPAAQAPGKAEPRRGKKLDEDIDDPLSLSLDDLEPLIENLDVTPGPDDDLQQRLTDALGLITVCYEGTDLPPAVEELRSLVEHRNYDGLRQSIAEVWNGLLGFHQKRGIRPHLQVTHAFNVIHGLVQT